MKIDKAVLGKMLCRAGALFQENSGKLSEIDSRFGDGDHGVTMNKIGLLLEKEVASWGEESLRDFIDGLGDKIMAIGGGSAGPLYGTLIGGLAIPLEDEAEIDAAKLKDMLISCKDEMNGITTARVGDKTMMDALIPAVYAAIDVEDDIGKILDAAATAAGEGAKASEGFVSKYGRAKSYKEQTIGTPDAGAVSTSLLFQGLAQGYRQ